MRAAHRYGDMPEMKSDTRDDRPPGSFVPTEDWIDAFEAQCTEKLMQCARRYAERRVRGLGRITDSIYARELVQDALTDTAIGVLYWDPSAKTLQRHIHDAIKTRTNHDHAHALKFPHEGLEVLNPDEESEILAEVDAVLLERAQVESDEPTEWAAERLARLRQIASGDRAVLRLLDAFAMNATSKADVMRIAGLSAVDYDNVRRRLRRLVVQLSNQSSRADISLPKETEHATR
jgi:hypothetical protein